MRTCSCYGAVTVCCLMLSLGPLRLQANGCCNNSTALVACCPSGIGLTCYCTFVFALRSCTHVLQGVWSCDMRPPVCLECCQRCVGYGNSLPHLILPCKVHGFGCLPSSGGWWHLPVHVRWDSLQMAAVIGRRTTKFRQCKVASHLASQYFALHLW